MARCALCGSPDTTCHGRLSNYTVPVGFGWFGPESGPAIGWNRPAISRVYDMGIVTLSREVRMADVFTATERLYLDPEGNVVKAKDPNRARLLIGAGQTMPMDEARRLGLVEEENGGGEKASRTAPETKAVKAPPENKSK